MIELTKRRIARFAGNRSGQNGHDSAVKPETKPVNNRQGNL
jgi:hypothetical protein